MCGISGIASFQNAPSIDPQWGYRMAQTLRHRGPDDEGFVLFSEDKAKCRGGTDTPSTVWESNYAYSPKAKTSEDFSSTLLAHRRLSILDVSARGHQPMCDTSGRFWITFNGEIYNYLEIKKDLEELGHHFFSTGDTEVILCAFIQWGKTCVQKFDGMWAFVIYDKEEQRLFCARDRFGVKPFYYYKTSQFFAFASEQKALLTLPFVEKKINEEAVFDYLVLMQTEKEETGFFKGILELMPSHTLQVHLPSGQMEKNKYYSLQYNASFGKWNPHQAATYEHETRELLINSVRLRLRSDVPIGACLSGGIDSSSLVCLADRFNLGEEQLHVFTATYPGLEIDESVWAQQIVNVTHSKWHQVHTKAEDLLSQYESLIYAQDIPFFGSSTLSQYKLMETIGQSGIKVTLDGQGADELFSGYPRHLSVHLIELISKGKMGELARYFLSKGRTSTDPVIKMWLRQKAEQSSPSNSYQWLKKSKYNFRLLKQDFWDKHQERYFQQRGNEAFQLNDYLHAEYTGHSLKYLMRTADRNSMRHSVESRVPFADDVHLAEYIFSLPTAYKIQQGKSKTLLRESMKGVLPEAIRNRVDKKGFVTPELLWFQQLTNEMKELVTENVSPFLEVDLLKKEWDMLFKSQLSGNTLGISRFLILSMWRKQFGV